MLYSGHMVTIDMTALIGVGLRKCKIRYCIKESPKVKGDKEGHCHKATVPDLKLGNVQDMEGPVGSLPVINLIRYQISIELSTISIKIGEIYKNLTMLQILLFKSLL